MRKCKYSNCEKHYSDSWVDKSTHIIEYHSIPCDIPSCGMPISTPKILRFLQYFEVHSVPCLELNCDGRFIPSDLQPGTISKWSKRPHYDTVHVVAIKCLKPNCNMEFLGTKKARINHYLSYHFVRCLKLNYKGKWIDDKSMYEFSSSRDNDHGRRRHYSVAHPLHAHVKASAKVLKPHPSRTLNAQGHLAQPNPEDSASPTDLRIPAKSVTCKLTVTWSARTTESRGLASPTKLRTLAKSTSCRFIGC